MSTLKHPVGPHASSVYWRRRLIVLFGIIVVIAVIVLIIIRPGAAGGVGPSAAGLSSSSPSTTTDSTTTGSNAKGSSAASTKASESPQAVTSDGAPCAPGQVTVEALTDSADYSDDELPKLSLVLTNAGSTSCTMNAGTSQQVYTIKSGKDIYWRSTDCQTEASDTEVLLEPGKEVKSAPIEWDRTRSATDTCDMTERTSAPAEGASYYLSTSVGGIQSISSKQFLLK